MIKTRLYKNLSKIFRHITHKTKISQIELFYWNNRIENWNYKFYKQTTISMNLKHNTKWKYNNLIKKH